MDPIEWELTRSTLDAFYLLYSRLGYGFLESVYVAGLAHELTKAGLTVRREAPIAVNYDGVVLGAYRADLLVENRLIVEVKADITPGFGPQRQLLNYLRSSDLEVGLLLVFGLQPWFKKLIHSRAHKRTSDS